MAWLLDTNVLLRSAERDHPMQTVALEALATLARQGADLCLVPQILIEYRAVATRPVDRNGLGMSVAEADADLTRMLERFRLVSDSPDVWSEWRRLVRAHNVVGVAVYDARIAAAMLMQGVSHILPFDVDGFRRFPGIQVMHPGEVDRSPAAENLS